MGTHTPGPWHRGGVVTTTVLGYPPPPDKIAVQVADANSSDLSPMEREANARLIAAAPELLEACKVAMDDMAKSLGDAVSWGNLSRAASRLDAAIAKAEGR